MHLLIQVRLFLYFSLFIHAILFEFNVMIDIVILSYCVSSFGFQFMEEWKATAGTWLGWLQKFFNLNTL
jgi:hypothetical protein